MVLTWTLIAINWTAKSSGHADDTTHAVWRHVAFFFCWHSVEFFQTVKRGFENITRASVATALSSKLFL